MKSVHSRFVLVCLASMVAVLAHAEQVQFQMHRYWCERMVGAQPVGADQCITEVNLSEFNCQELGPRLDMLTDEGQRVGADLMLGGDGGFCGRQTIEELMVLAQDRRQRVMSYVSYGLDERRCDPVRPDQSHGCAKGPTAAYHLYMCAAYRCKYGR